jgi:hypothetical protein
MQGLQYIIDNASAIEIARPRTVAQMMTRSGRMRTAERTALQLYQIKVTPPTYSRYEDVRDVIEGITVMDRDKFAWVKLSNSSGMNYITDYRGELTDTQVNALRVASTGSTATVFADATIDTSDIFGYTTSTVFNAVQLGGIPNIGATLADGSTCTSATLVFKSGDYIQLRTLAGGATSLGIPRTVSADVARGTGTTVTVPVHRPWVDILTGADRRGGDIAVGNEVRISVFMAQMPSFQLLPGKIVQWTGDFELIERVA